MSTGIQWTEETWNPVAGCMHVSEGCDNCYAAELTSGRLSQHPAYAGLAVDGRFTGEIRLLPERLKQPFRWKKPRFVFVNSMSDLFHRGVPPEFLDRVFAVMARTPQHTYQILTKRPGRLLPYLVGDGITRRPWIAQAAGVSDVDLQWPLPNVWLGTSVENQKWADVRIPHLLRTPAAVRFLSCEPLLGPMDLTALLGGRLDALAGDAKTSSGEIYAGGASVDWVIVGGESGRNHRPMDIGWVRDIRDQCAGAGVPFFFKQIGGRTPKAGGRELDGRTWDEMPKELVPA